MKSVIVRVAFRTALVAIIIAPMWAAAAELDQIHLMADDSKAGVQWYAKHFGGTIPKGSSRIVLFGNTALIIHTAKGEYLSNVGSVVNHLAFSVPDVQAKMTELEEVGVKVKRWGRNALKLPPVAALLYDPWGTRIEILKDDEFTGFHHVHLKTQDPKGTAEWYSKVFGVEIGRYKNLTQIYALRFGDAYIFVQRSIRPVEAIVGRSVDHITVKIHDFNSEMKRLKAMGTKFLQDPHQAAKHLRATIEGPDGLPIELVDVLTSS